MAKQEEEMIDFVIPGQEEADMEPTGQTETNEAPDKSKMSLFWLLQHYNKDNAAIYKAQKAEKKKEKAGKNKKGKKQAAQKQISPKQTIKTEADTQVQRGVPSWDQQPVRKEKKELSSEEDNFGKTVYIERDKRPGLADQQIPMKAALDCLSYGQTVRLDKMPFIIGRNPKAVNLCIADNKTVGRMHAVITYHSGSFYIKDLKSLNHVYLDGKQILPETETPLKNRMKITIGSEQFVFLILDA